MRTIQKATPIDPEKAGTLSKHMEKRLAEMRARAKK
jgi:hypothetical protein